MLWDFPLLSYLHYCLCMTFSLWKRCQSVCRRVPPPSGPTYFTPVWKANLISHSFLLCVPVCEGRSLSVGANVMITKVFQIPWKSCWSKQVLRLFRSDFVYISCEIIDFFTYYGLSSEVTNIFDIRHSKKLYSLIWTLSLWYLYLIV